jgi:hypothetical protein
VDRQRSSGGVQIGSSNGTEPGDAGGAASRALEDCCSSEVDSGKTLLMGVGEIGISRSVVKGGNDGMLNLTTSWNNQCSKKTT